MATVLGDIAFDVSPSAFAQKEKADSTSGCSRAVPHPSTNQALCRLTSEVGRDPVYSTRYGRQRMPYFPCAHVLEFFFAHGAATRGIEPATRKKKASVVASTLVYLEPKWLRCLAIARKTIADSTRRSSQAVPTLVLTGPCPA